MSLQLMIEKKEEKKYKIINYEKKLSTTVNFKNNKEKSIHRWYQFVEGFSEEFINSILDEVSIDDVRCLELFAGSGTTPLVLQKKNIKCYSFEVSPFMHLLTKTKLRTDYSMKGYKKSFETIIDGIKFSERQEKQLIKAPIMKSIVENGVREKWLFNSEVMNGILDIKYGISQVKDKKYRDLFKVALASILLEISNVYRNGKCLSYKKNWTDKVIKRSDVHDKFVEKSKNTFEEDIKLLQGVKDKRGKQFSNHKFCFNKDVRNGIDSIIDNSINLVITSPPYLNSRDYTDAYMIELWVLDLIEDYSNLRSLRKNTIRSHVQVKWEPEKILKIDPLISAYEQILIHKDLFWNQAIPDMIIGYFNDMDLIFRKLNKKIMTGGKIYFNVANSAYYGVHIPTDMIIAEIAENNGFSVEEIRIARFIQPSSQQKSKIQSLRESVIVITKK